MKMNHEQMIEYIKQMNDKPFKTKEEARAVAKKVEALLKKFGYEFYATFGMMCRPMTNQDTSCFYRKQLAEYEYHEVQIGYIVDKVYTGKSRGKKHYLDGYKGLCRVDLNHKVSLNPETGRPWQIGDWDHSNPHNPARLTKRGWYTGD